MADATDGRRGVPAVHEILSRPGVRKLERLHGRDPVLRELRAGLAELRERIAAGLAAGENGETLEAALRQRLQGTSSPSLLRVVNATGVVVHTNLGRSPLPRGAAQRVAEVAGGYSNLEFDLASGSRGNREAHAETRLQRLLGVEASAVVNNCAAAVLLALNSLAEGREVVVSRGELVEVGGAFRIPDVLAKSGARLREVGTTNRTRLADYRAALRPETGLILKVHPSNYRVVGFVEETPLAELAVLAHEAGVPLVEDLGNGLLEPLAGPLANEPSVSQSLAAGVDVVAMSGDKLLGGPQAGLLAGRAQFVTPMLRNPLYRALRVDKMTLAALDAVLLEYESGRAAQTVPVQRMLALTPEDVRPRAERLALRLRDLGYSVELQLGVSAAGGGAAPTTDLPTCLLALTHPTLSGEQLTRLLRDASPPVIARIADGRLVLDLRTVEPGEDDVLRAALEESTAG